MMCDRSVRSESQANKYLEERVIVYSDSWLHPSRHVYQVRKRVGFWQRLIRWSLRFTGF